MSGQRKNDLLIKNISERFKAIREERGLTQEKVRADTDMNIGRIEMGQHSMTVRTLWDLCDYYGITLEDFFRGIESK